mgnify:FL=1
MRHAANFFRLAWMTANAPPMSYQPRVSSARYTAEPVPKTYPGSQGWTCPCDVPKYKKHRDPWACRTEFTTTQQVLAWMKEEFGR